MTELRRFWYLEYMAVAICAWISLFILNSPPVNFGVFLGDDLQVWEGHNTGTFASNFQESIRNSSLDKWRPLNTIFMISILNVLGDSYRNFYFFSTGLLMLVLVAMWVNIRSITPSNSKSKFVVPMLGVLVVGSSPFTFFARSGVFGLLEIGPVILCLASFHIYQRARKQESRRLVTYSSLIALSAGLIHERFFMFSFALMAMLAWRSREIRRFQGMWLLPLCNVIFYVYSGAVVLNANVLKGGGESNLNESIGLWILPRYVNAIIHLLGGAGGESVFYDPSKPTLFTRGMMFDDNYSLVLPVIVVALLLSVYLSFFRPREERSQVHTDSMIVHSQCKELLLVSAALLLPAATVAGRIEARWLFGSLVFLVVAVSSSPPQQLMISRVGRLGILVLLTFGNLSNRDSYKEFSWWRIRGEGVLDAVRNNSPASGAWNVAVVWPDGQDINSVTRWALGGGKVFRDLDNGPHEIVFGTSDQVSRCPAPCLIIEATDVGNTKGDYRKAEFQSITTYWKY